MFLFLGQRIRDLLLSVTWLIAGYAISHKLHIVAVFSSTIACV